MATRLTPVDGDPFAQAATPKRQPKLTPVNGDPFKPAPPSKGLFDRLVFAITRPDVVDKMNRDADAAVMERTARVAKDVQHSDGIFDRAGDLLARGAHGVSAGLDRAVRPFLPSAKQQSGVALTRLNERIAGTVTPQDMTWKKLKERPSAANIGQYVLEQGVQSLPAMGTAMASLPVYALSNSGNIAEQRAQNSGRADTSMGDVGIAAPAGLASAFLERIGLGRIVAPGVGNIAVRAGKAGLAEGLTEAGQSGVEYAGGAAGTDQGFKLTDMLDQMAQGAAAGAPLGVVGHPAVEAPHALVEAVQGARAVREASTLLPDPPAQLSAPLEPVPDAALPPRVVAPKLVPIEGDPFVAPAAPEAVVAPQPAAPQGATVDDGGLGQGAPDPGPEKLTPVEGNPFPAANPIRFKLDTHVLGQADFGAPDANGDWMPDEAKTAAATERVKAALAEGRPVHYIMDDEGAKPIAAVRDGKMIKEDGNPLATVALVAEPDDYYRIEIGPKPEAKPDLPPVASEPVNDPQALQDGEKYVRTPAGNKVRTRMEVVDASTLKRAEGEFQNRDRSRDTTDLQVQDIIGKFDPELLGDDPSSDRGAPVVGQDHTVYSGNGRMLSLNKIFEQYPEKADAYRRFIESQGHSTEGVDRPVLIRRIAQDMTPAELRQFVVESNKDNKLSLSPVEKARSDADAVTPGMLDKYAGGDLNSSANSGFVGEFTKKMTAGELGDFIGSDRRLTTTGIERIENAVVAKAYDHPKLLEKLMESAHNEIRAITSSLANVAPSWAKMRAATKGGEIQEHYDITSDLADAAMRVAEARRRGTKPADILTQMDAFNRPSPVAEALVEAFYTPGMKRPASVKSVTGFLQDYIDTARDQQETTDIFGTERKGIAPLDILRKLLRERDAPNGEGLFDAKESFNDPSDDGHLDTNDTPVRRRTAPAEEAVEDTADIADTATGPYRRTHAQGAMTDRPSDLRSAVEHLGMAWDDFNLKAPPTQMRLLQRAISEKLGITVTVDHGELGASKRSIPYRVAIDQMLDAFHNVTGMAAVLGLPEKAMSLNGTLTLELRKQARFYGAYYPGLEKIALPGRSNAFAHEWGHALDYHLLGQLAARDGTGLSGLIRKSGKGATRGSPLVADRFTELMKTMFFDRSAEAVKIMELESKIAATKSPSTKAQLQKQIDRIQAGAGQHRTGRTEFYRNAKAVDAPLGEPGGGYWQKPTEMLARSFEAYVAKKAGDAGMSTEVISHADADYLSNADERLAKTFPKEAERAAIFSAFDDLFDTLSDRQTLGSGEKARIPENPERREEAKPEQLNVFKRIVRNELGAFVDAKRSNEKHADRPKDRKGFAQKANDIRHFIFSGMGAEMLALGKRHNSKAIQTLHDLFVPEAGKGNRLQRRDFISARRLRANRYGNSIERALIDHGPRRVEGGNSHATVLSKAQADDVRAMLTNEDHDPAFPELKTFASRLREISDGIFYDLRNAGFNLGYARNGHLTRIYDAAKAEADPTRFRELAQQVYELTDMEPAEARKAAADWHFRLTTNSALDFDQHQPQGDFLKARALPPEADTIMADFMMTEPVDLMRRYAEAAAHRIEWAKRFGVHNGVLNGLYDRMAREGVDSRDVDTIRTMADIMAGRNPMRSRNPVIAAAGAMFNTIYGTVALLPRAVFQSLSETITAGIVMENPTYGLKAFTNNIAQALGTPSAKERRELVEFLGMVDTTHQARLLADRFGANYDDPALVQKINNKLFHNTGLVALTRAQVTGALDVTNTYLIHLSHKLLKAEEGSSAAKEVLARFNELGIRDPQGFATWMSGKGGPSMFHRSKLPTKEELAEGLDESGSAPWAFDWATANRRLSERIIQDPHAMTKPQLSHAGLVGKLVTGIQAFNYSFYDNVLKAALKRNMERVSEGRSAMATKATAMTMAGFATLYVGALVQTTLRVFLTDRERWDDEDEKGTLLDYLLYRTATQFVGNPLDPLVQMFAGLKYNRKPLEVLPGPALGNFAANVGDILNLGVRNSRKTNTAEHNAINGSYRLMSPWAAAGVGMIPGGPIVSGAEGVAQGYLTSPRAGRDLADAVVGKKNGRVGRDGKKIKSGPTAFDHLLDRELGEVKRKTRDSS